jgi:hypothetical protein
MEHPGSCIRPGHTSVLQPMACHPSCDDGDRPHSHRVGHFRFDHDNRLTSLHSTRWSTDANTDLKTSTKRTTTTTTETITETATVTPAPMVPRAANAQLRYNAANAIFKSVLASGTDSAIPSTTPLNNEQEVAHAELTTACLCMNVDPTSTVTSTFTAPTQVSVD